MRKVIFSLIAALLMPAAAAAQLPSLGVKAGTNIAKISGDGGSSDSMTGLIFGAYTSLPLGPALSLQPEALFSQKGFKNTVGSTDITNTLSYLSVPVLARMNFGLGGVGPYIFAGPEFGFMLSAKASGGGHSQSIKDDFKSFDLSGVVGAGMGFGKLSIDARYDLGLASIADDGSAKNRVITVLIGYSIF